MAGLTLDAGALIAVERDVQWVRASLNEAHARNEMVTIPAGALAQAWRGARNARVSRLVNASFMEVLDEQLAKRVGELLARSRTSDVVDAAVAVGAAARGDIVLTSDPDDLERLRPFATGSFNVQAV